MSVSEKADYDSDDSLPNLSTLFPGPNTSKDNIAKDDIVWAKFKNLYWPAIVRCVYPKEKKLSIWYSDAPGKTFKVPLKNVYLFHDAKMRSKIEKDVREAGCVKEHEGLTSHATEFLRRKAQGIVDDPIKFFDQTYPYFSVEALKEKNPDADVSDIKIRPLYISHEKKNIKSQNVNKNVKNNKLLNVKSDVGSENESSDDDTTTKTVQKDYLSEANKKISVVSKDDENKVKIVEFVKSGKADVHLKEILSKSVSSEYYDIYEKESKKPSKVMTNKTFTGPLSNDKVRELIDYLLSFYDSVRTTRQTRLSSRRCKTKVSEYPFLDKKNCDLVVSSVLLPESIIYAISVINDVSLLEAKKLFQDDPESEKKVEKILALVSDDEPCTSGVGSKNVQKVSGNNEPSDKNLEICSPFKKLCTDNCI